MATTFVFSPVPRFYQLAAKTRFAPFTQHIHNLAAREELPYTTDDQSTSQNVEDNATNELPSSPFQTTFSDFFFRNTSAHSQRFYTASLCCPGDEVIESSKTDKYTRPVGPITPPKGYVNNSRYLDIATSAEPTPIVPATSNQTVSRWGHELTINSKDDCSDWLNLSSYKQPSLTVSNPAPNSEFAPQNRITPPPGSKSRLARILNAQKEDRGSTAFSFGLDVLNR